MVVGHAEHLQKSYSYFSGIDSRVSHTPKHLENYHVYFISMQKCATKVEPSTSSTKGKNHCETPKLCPCRLWMLYEVVGLGNHCRFEKNDWFHQLQAFLNGIQPSGKRWSIFPAKRLRDEKQMICGSEYIRIIPHRRNSNMEAVQPWYPLKNVPSNMVSRHTSPKPNLGYPCQSDTRRQAVSKARRDLLEGRDVNGNMKWKRNPLEIRRRVRYMISSFWVSRPISLTIIYKTKLKKLMTFYKNHGPSTSKPSSSHRLQVVLENPTLAWQGQQNKQPVLGGPGRSTWG